MSTEDNGRLQFYQSVCESYHNVDDFRMKLLGLLPVATGAGVFLLLSGKAELLDNAAANANAQESLVQYALGAIGIFGFLFTVGLFAYELFGIKKCHYLIRAGTKLEEELHIRGQFRNRPAAVAGFVAEPFASSIIYPASMAAWLFLGLFFVFDDNNWWVAPLAAGLVVVAGCAGTMFGADRIKKAQKAEDDLLDLLRSHGPIEWNQSRDKFELKRLRAARRLENRHEVEIVEGKVLLLDDRAPSPPSTAEATPGESSSGQMSGSGRAL